MTINRLSVPVTSVKKQIPQMINENNKTCNTRVHLRSSTAINKPPQKGYKYDTESACTRERSNKLSNGVIHVYCISGYRSNGPSKLLCKHCPEFLSKKSAMLAFCYAD